jgi:hypothetical protein
VSNTGHSNFVRGVRGVASSKLEVGLLLMMLPKTSEKGGQNANLVLTVKKASFPAYDDVWLSSHRYLYIMRYGMCAVHPQVITE